jgi:DNA-binding SARP family transcriptional activator
LQVQLLGGFGVESLVTPRLAVQRLVAYLAIKPRPHQREDVAAALWPYRSRDQAASNLRNTLFRARQEGEQLVESSRRAVRLVPEAQTDLLRAEDAVRRLMSGGPPWPDDVELLSEDILPGWNDPWVRTERRRWHERRVEALEMLSERLCQLGRHGEAAAAALAAVSAEPFRERAAALLADAHLAAGDPITAAEIRDAYRERVGMRSGESAVAQTATRWGSSTRR